MNKKTIAVLSDVYHTLLTDNCYVETPFKDVIAYEFITFTMNHHPYRFFVHSLCLQKGKSDFDRWANSFESEITLNKLDANQFFKKLAKL